MFKKAFITIVGVILSGKLNAIYRCKVFVKYPFPIIEERVAEDTVIIDTIVFSSGTQVKINIYRKQTLEKSTREGITQSSFDTTFEYWGDNTPITLANIDHIDIELPNAELVKRAGAQIILEPVIFRNVSFGRSEEEDTIIVTLKEETVQNNRVTIGWGKELFKFAIIADPHIGTGGWDFESHVQPPHGGEGYDPPWGGTDGDGGANTRYIKNVIAVRDYIKKKIQDGEDIKLVVALGDLTDSAERSELEHVRERILKPIGVTG